MDSLQTDNSGDQLPRSQAPSTARLTVAMLEAWLAAAQPGARLPYYSGVFAGEGSHLVNERLRAEADRNMVFLVQQRRTDGRNGFDYIAVRSSRAWAGGPPKRPTTMAEQARAWQTRSGHLSRQRPS